MDNSDRFEILKSLLEEAKDAGDLELCDLIAHELLIELDEEVNSEEDGEDGWRI